MYSNFEKVTKNEGINGYKLFFAALNKIKINYRFCVLYGNVNNTYFSSKYNILFFEIKRLNYLLVLKLIKRVVM